MKKRRQQLTFLLMGIVLFTSCTEEKVAKAPAKMVDKVEIEPADEPVQDTIRVPEAQKERLSKQPQPPVPTPPWPGDPWEPVPDPRMRPPEGIPEPPIPVEVPNPNDDIVDIADPAPEFIGGQLAMSQFIQATMKYPEIDKEMGNQGKVYVRFVVEKDGSITQIEIARGVTTSMDKEAKRIVRAMPNWKPGELQGNVVRCRFVIPILFKLD